MNQSENSLKGEHLQLYTACCFQPNLAITEAGQRLHNRFNEKLKKQLLEYQKQGYIPTKNSVEEQAVDLLSRLREESQKSEFLGSKSLHETARMIDNAIKCSQYTPIFTEENRIQILISIDALTIPKEGIKWIQESLQGEYNESWCCIQVCLADVVNPGDSVNSYINRIHKAGLNGARDRFRKYAKENYNVYSGFHYTLIEKAQDWIAINV